MTHRGDTGHKSRHLLAGLLHKTNIYHRLYRLENQPDWPAGGPVGGGDPNFGFPPPQPQILTASPVLSWDGHTWHLGATVAVAYDPPPDFLYLEAQFDGPNFHADFQLTPFASPFTATDLGFALGGTYQVQVRAWSRTKGPSDWSDPFTGIYFAESPLFPPAPTNVRLNTAFALSGYRYADTGVELSLTWDYAGLGPDWWHLNWWRIGDEDHPAHITFPGTQPPKQLIQGLLRLQTYHFEVYVERGGYVSAVSTPFLPTIPVENPGPPTAVVLNTGALPPAGYQYRGASADAAVKWTLAGDGLTNTIHVEFTPAGGSTIAWDLPGTWTGAFFQNLTVGVVYTFKFWAVDLWGYRSSGATIWMVTIPVPDPPPPTLLAPNPASTAPYGYGYRSPDAGWWDGIWTAAAYSPAPGAEVGWYHVRVLDSGGGAILWDAQLPVGWGGFRWDGPQAGQAVKIRLWAVTSQNVQGSTYYELDTTPLPVQNPPAPATLALDTTRFPHGGYWYDIGGPEAGLIWTSWATYTPAPGAEIAKILVQITDTTRNEVYFFAEYTDTTTRTTLSTPLLRLQQFKATVYTETTTGVDSPVPTSVAFTVPNEAPAPVAPTIVAQGIDAQGGWFQANFTDPWWKISAWIIYWQLHTAPTGSQVYSQHLPPFFGSAIIHRDLLPGKLYDVWLDAQSADGAFLSTSPAATVTIPKAPKPGVGTTSETLGYTSPDGQLDDWEVQTQVGGSTYGVDPTVVLSGAGTLKLTVTS